MRWLLPCLLLVGCAAKMPPEPVVITKRVEVAVAVPCKVTLPEEKPLPSEQADLSGDIWDLAKLVLMDRQELLARLAEWRAAAKSCS